MMAKKKTITQATADETRDSGASQQSTPPIEWLVAALGVILLVAMLGYMVFFGLTRPESPPQILVTYGDARPEPPGYALEFTASNKGGSTATQTLIKGVLKRGDEIVEEAEATIDYIPHTSDRKGTLIFKENPSSFELEVGVTGFADP
nr:TIGR02588 family protein [Rhizobium sp. Q54]